VISTVDLGAWQALLARQARTEAARATAARDGAVSANGVTGASAAAAAAGGDIESRLSAIWSDILGVQQVGPNDNFFELGGHSLLAVRLLTRVERLFGRVVTMPELFRTPTIAGLAAILREIQPDSGSRPKEPALRAVSRDAFLVSRKKLTPDRS
jgi:acyl carrier protein